ncbi:Gnl2 [Symbiodinium microadriaticum]|nr:Gnl2 [Symbiodinium microadriaticum]
MLQPCIRLTEVNHSQNKCNHDILSTEPHMATTSALKVLRTTLAFLRLDQATGTMTPCLFANLRHSVATTKVSWYELLFFDVAKEASEKAQKVACCKKGELTSAWNGLEAVQMGIGRMPQGNSLEANSNSKSLSEVFLPKHRSEGRQSAVLLLLLLPVSRLQEEVTYACEYCRTKYGTYGEAEACEDSDSPAQKLPQLNDSWFQATASTAPPAPPPGPNPPSGTPAVPHGLPQAMLLPVPLPQLRPQTLRPSAGPGPELASLLSGSKGALPPPEEMSRIGKGLQVLAAKGVLPGLLGKGTSAPSVPRGKGPEGAPPSRDAPLALQQGASVADPFLREVQDFMERWDLEKRFEPKLVAYLKRTGAPPLQARSNDEYLQLEELQRLERELRHAGVPPVCRSGYLLVVFGEVSEKSTDEDFRYLLTGKREGRDGLSPSPEKRQKEDAGAGDKSTGTGAKPSNDRGPDRGNSERGNSERESRGNSAGVPPLSEGWMNEEARYACTPENCARFPAPEEEVQSA